MVIPVVLDAQRSLAGPHRWREQLERFGLLAVALSGLGAGAVLHLLSVDGSDQLAWAGATIVVVVWLAASIVERLRRREIGVDVIAVVAMGGALLLGENFVGAIIAVMLTGGRALEDFAAARARRELTALIKRAPQRAHLRRGSAVVDVDVKDVAKGDFVVVMPGEVIPTDGICLSPSALLDEAALTGEARAVQIERGAVVRSGGSNAGGPLELRATAPAAEGTYAAIIRLVAAAEKSKAPFARLADRYALAFLALTLSLAGLAWIWAGPERALAVVVVATPCPLLLAVPTAIIAGVSFAARHGIIVKGGGPLETLARVTIVLLDKTGTVTSARPQVVGVETFSAISADELIRLAACVEQASIHPYAPAIVAEARTRKIELSWPADAQEAMGAGLSGDVDGRRIMVGQLAFVAPSSLSATPPAGIRSVELRTAVEGTSSAFVSIDGELAGAFLIQDPIRVEAPRVLRGLRSAGVRRIDIVTGDHPDVAELVGDVLGVDRVFAERTPEEKVHVVEQLRREGVVALVGDGINDAPALASADVGIAMGARGATAASEAADVVLTSERLEGLLNSVLIAQRTRRIALQSAFVGMSLSLAAMGFAAAGYLAPVAGAVLQEGIDIVVILNALRALGGGRLFEAKAPRSRELGQKLASAHRWLRPRVNELVLTAAHLDTLPPALALAELQRVRSMLENELLPHELEEQRTAYPLVVEMLGDEDPTGPLVQTHHEIQRLIRIFARLIVKLPPDGPRAEDQRDLRRVLYGLHAVLVLHFAQEDELFSLLDA
ncbi:MAG: heavy metal translocating P-type ATPase [Deltaproteobacteria bacterium]|nr:heavy metal translocating P-type ATPase [Deltaproteobacteria bacterium]